MKDRSSTPPLHVHVDENTPVHVHIKKLPKPSAASSQVGAWQRGEVTAVDQGTVSRPSLLALLTPKVWETLFFSGGQLAGKKVGLWFPAVVVAAAAAATVTLLRRGPPAKVVYATRVTLGSWAWR